MLRADRRRAGAPTTAKGVPAAVAGWGAAVPDRRLTNAELERRLDTADAWIVERTGIRQRRVAGPGETTATLAVKAGAAAIEHAGLRGDDIDLVVVATVTPDQPMPATAAFVQRGLDLACGGFDLNAACAGFVYALVAVAAIAATGDRTVLLIGSDTFTRITNPDDRSTAVLFGDGAGALVLRPAKGGAGRGVVSWDWGCDGSLAHLLEVAAGGSRLPTSEATVMSGAHWLRMEGRELFRRAVNAVVDSALVTLAQAGVATVDVDLFVPHQANLRIVQAATARLGIPPDRVVVNIDRYGNTAAASIPMALAEAAEDGRLGEDDLVLLSGFGAGMTWATALVRWGRR